MFANSYSASCSHSHRVLQQLTERLIEIEAASWTTLPDSTKPCTTLRIRLHSDGVWYAKGIAYVLEAHRPKRGLGYTTEHCVTGYSETRQMIS